MTDLVKALSDLSEEEADDFFRETQAETVVELVGRTSDRDLQKLIAVDHVRSAAVTNVLSRLEEFAVPERLAAVEGMVRFVLSRPHGDTETYSLRFTRGRVTLLPPDVEGTPDVVIDTDFITFIRLVSGGENAALLLLGGRLSVRGDEMLALGVGGVFRVPGSEGVAVDPTSLDPVDVATALNGVKDDHLRDVMSSDFRFVVLEEVFRRMPEFVDAEKVHRHNISVRFTITGRPDGEVDEYVVHVRKGACFVDAGPGERHDARITTSGADFLKLVTGHLNPALGLMRGHLRVHGDVTAALTFSRLMHIPKARH